MDLKLKQHWQLYTLLVLYTVGAFGLQYAPLMSFFLPLTGWILLLTFILLLSKHKPYDGRFTGWALIVLVGSFLMEWLGVKTGAIFGEYHYTSLLGYHLDGVPVVIAMNWFVLVYGCIEVCSRITKNKWAKIIFVAVMMTAIDVLLEKVAARFHFWVWANEKIPAENYIAWFALSFVFALLYEELKVKTKNPIAIHVLIILVLFLVSFRVF